MGLKDFKVSVKVPSEINTLDLNVLLHNAVINSNIPQGSGLGSSAALSVALARCYTDDNNNIYNLAKAFDDRFHDGSSGIDVYTSIQGGLIKFQNGLFEKMSSNFLRTLKQFKFSIINTNTQRKVKEVKSTINKEYYTEFIKEAAVISNNFTDKLLNDSLDLCDMINLFSNYQRILKKLNVSTELIDTITTKLSEQSSIGVKITGGGGGGCLLLAHDGNVSESLILEILRVMDENLILYYDIKFTE